MAKVKGGKKKAAKNVDSNKPQIIAAKGGLTQAALLDRVMEKMESENWITKKQGKDFVATLQMVVGQELAKGNPVNLFGIVRVVPRLHTAGEREVYKVFGDPTSGKTKKKAKAKVTLKTGQGIFGKNFRDALPSPQKMANSLNR